ncbi:hypothetical protein FOA43_003343 [Brettanomyces nanus]|uniref:Uncharacterized protein n=1 Tax=Eeniella nana TaxID=13502 RepID=A0A875RW08_EENNA|nr:uncharacterized protein FOA43_003343 [Brettanomyces nanus]QPG75957.1 hypothetical protein FOA43_003343 [Brettanomyces nanus]
MCDTINTPVPSILFVVPVNAQLPEFQSFQSQFHPVFLRLSSKDELIKKLKQDPQLANICAIYAGFLGFQPIGGLISDGLIDALPSSVKIVTVCSAGFNGYDLTKLRAHGIDFCNTPNFGAPQVAETALYHIINGFRKYHVFEDKLRQTGNTIDARTELQEYYDFDSSDGKFKLIDRNSSASIHPWFAFGEKVSRNLFILSPRGKTITIVGLGNIGRELAYRVHALGMNIRYVNRHRLSDEKNLGFPVRYYQSLLEAAPGTDCVALCLPSTPETAGMFNCKVIERLNDGCCVVNVGRGNLIVDDDLLTGLKSGKIGHAGLDVLEAEPIVNEELVCRDDVTITPHLGSCTKEVYNATEIFCLENITNRLLKGEAKNILN